MTTKFNIEEKAEVLYIKLIEDDLLSPISINDPKTIQNRFNKVIQQAYDAGKLEERQQLALMVDKIGTYQEGIEEPFVISAEEAERNLKLARDIRNRK